MPRGGKRPGAGAPKGNFNAVRSGNHSSRMLLVYLTLLNHPDRKAVAWELYEQGFFPPPRKRFNGDVRGVVTYLYRRWFDSSAAQSINNDQTGAAAPAETRAASFAPAPSNPGQPKISRNREKQDSIKPAPAPAHLASHPPVCPSGNGAVSISYSGCNHPPSRHKTGRYPAP